MIRTLVTVATVLIVAGCASRDDLLPDVALGYRNPTAPLGGTARFDAARFAGDWRAVSCLGPCPGSLRFAVGGDGRVIETRADGARAYDVDGPGILRQIDSDRVLVVMWVDEGFRTAALGDADGQGAMIIDRSARPGADRVAAAAEILDFNGWDISRLQEVTE